MDASYEKLELATDILDILRIKKGRTYDRLREVLASRLARKDLDKFLWMIEHPEPTETGQQERLGR